MTNLKMAVLSGMVMTAALAGCSSSNYDTPPATPTAALPYEQTTANYMPNHRVPTSAGQVMTTPQGATVYTFDKDEDGQSSCYSKCATDWPPVTAESDAEAVGLMTLTVRTDGQRQWVYDGKPLYTYAEDRMHGDVKGNNVGSVWHVVK